MSRLLLLSNSTMPGTSFFTWPQSFVRDFLGKETGEMVFIPFAAVTFSFAEYEEKVAQVFSAMDYRVKSIHHANDQIDAIRKAKAIIVGGGNSFALLSRVYEAGLVEIIRDRISSGIPYIGWSAGANISCPTIMTTNDMPIVQPPSLNALNLVPFQINPHYHELKFENQGGETRKERLEEFLVLNPERSVIGLPEGMGLRREGNTLTTIGTGTAKLYQHGASIKEIGPGENLNYLL